MARILRSKKTFQVWTFLMTAVLVLFIVGPGLLRRYMRYEARGTPFFGWRLAIGIVFAFLAAIMWYRFLTEWTPTRSNIPTSGSHRHYWFWPFSFLFPSMGEVPVPRWALAVFWAMILASLLLVGWRLLAT